MQQGTTGNIPCMGYTSDQLAAAALAAWPAAYGWSIIVSTNPGHLYFLTVDSAGLVYNHAHLPTLPPSTTEEKL